MMKRVFPVFLFILSIVFLIPGVTQPLMTIKATVDKQEILTLATKSLFPLDQSKNLVQQLIHNILQQINLQGQIEVFESTRSLLGTMSHLISNDHLLVGVLIGLFGVIIPVVKILLILTSFTAVSSTMKKQLLFVSGSLSKWSMSDVFMMAILVAFLAINANEHAIKPVQMNAELGSGFYFFSCYCLLAIAANQMLKND